MICGDRYCLLTSACLNKSKERLNRCDGLINSGTEEIVEPTFTALGEAENHLTG